MGKRSLILRDYLTKPLEFKYFKLIDPAIVSDIFPLFLPAIPIFIEYDFSSILFFGLYGQRIKTGPAL
jgi:hypothetical protein